MRTLHEAAQDLADTCSQSGLFEGFNDGFKLIFEVRELCRQAEANDPGIEHLKEANKAFGNHTAIFPAVPTINATTQMALKGWALTLAAMAASMKEDAAQLRAQGLTFDALVLIRVQLSVEETGEWVEALASGDIVRAAKELLDISYVTDGHYLTLGLGDLKLALYRAVQASNMSKLDEDGRPIINEAGRWVKGPNYKPAEPEVARIISRAQAGIIGDGAN